MPSLQALLGISRGPFLLLPLALVATATAAVACAGPWNPAAAGLALFGLLALVGYVKRADHFFASRVPLG